MMMELVRLPVQLKFEVVFVNTYTGFFFIFLRGLQPWDTFKMKEPGLLGVIDFFFFWMAYL